MTLKSKFYKIMSMIVLAVAFLAFCTVLYPEKVIIGTDNLIWNVAEITILVFWGIVLLLDKRGIFDNYLLTISTAIVFVGIVIRHMTIPQVPLLLYVFAIFALIYGNRIPMFIKKYNEHKKLSDDVFTDLISISFATFVVVCIIASPVIILSIIAIIILFAITWGLV